MTNATTTRDIRPRPHATSTADSAAGHGREPNRRPLLVAWASGQDDVRDAQRLRHAVFAGEMGARLNTPSCADDPLDVDRFDAYCEHLIVRERLDDGGPGKVVGTYRVLTPESAARAGGLYSETEFDLSPLAPLRAGMVELGRSCVHPDWRTGGVVMALWGALGGFMARNGFDTMVGCASTGMRDGGHVAASLWRRLEGSHPADARWRVTPRLPLPVDELQQDLEVEPPPLLKGYLRCGARVLGAPAWDPDFNTADFPLLLRLSDLPARYRSHFLNG